MEHIDVNSVLNFLTVLLLILNTILTERNGRKTDRVQTTVENGNGPSHS
jgi:hypothetical protein